jgi:protein-S-isoprenylcysteine O-methyltransferase Ste14
MFSKENIRSSLLHYLSGVILYGLGVWFYHSNNYYVKFLDPLTKDILLYLYLAYVVIAPFYYLIKLNKDTNEHKPILLFGIIKRSLIDFYRYLKTFVSEPGKKITHLSKQEKTVLLFMLVKLFYIPLMTNFLVGNTKGLIGYWPYLKQFKFDLYTISYTGYGFMMSLVFLIDTLFFTFGYLAEAGWLKNKVRSVEPTMLGWSVTLICYPPFNDVFGMYVPWGPRDYSEFGTLTWTFIARLAIILLLFIYLWATLSLGTKCSNLTNRGIVGRGAYRWMRHPAYISKNMAWWIMAIPGMNFAVFLSILIWSGVYFMRAITEERHLSMDPDYQLYCKKTKYRFIPGIY